MVQQPGAGGHVRGRADAKVLGNRGRVSCVIRRVSLPFAGRPDVPDPLCAPSSSPNALPSADVPLHECMASAESSARFVREFGRKIAMLYTVAVVLIVLWLLGMITSYTMSGFIHVLLVIAIIVVLIRVIQGKNILGAKN